MPPHGAVPTKTFAQPDSKIENLQWWKSKGAVWRWRDMGAAAVCKWTQIVFIYNMPFLEEALHWGIAPVKTCTELDGTNAQTKKSRSKESPDMTDALCGPAAATLLFPWHKTLTLQHTSAHVTAKKTVADGCRGCDFTKGSLPSSISHASTCCQHEHVMDNCMPKTFSTIQDMLAQKGCKMCCATFWHEGLR